jgi:hypothetical protein
MQFSKKMLALAGFAAVALAAVPAFAHHSFAMFDNQKRVTLEGTIKEFQWTNRTTPAPTIIPRANGSQRSSSTVSRGPSR